MINTIPSVQRKLHFREAVLLFLKCFFSGHLVWVMALTGTTTWRYVTWARGVLYWSVSTCLMSSAFTISSLRSVYGAERFSDKHSLQVTDENWKFLTWILQSICKAYKSHMKLRHLFIIATSQKYIKENSKFEFINNVFFLWMQPSILFNKCMSSYLLGLFLQLISISNSAG